MPSCMMTWHKLPDLSVVNPKKSAPVNDLIKLVKMKEMRKQGKPTQARKQFEQPEYEKVSGLLKEVEDDATRCF